MRPGERRGEISSSPGPQVPLALVSPRTLFLSHWTEPQVWSRPRLTVSVAQGRGRLRVEVLRAVVLKASGISWSLPAEGLRAGFHSPGFHLASRPSAAGRELRRGQGGSADCPGMAGTSWEVQGEQLGPGHPGTSDCLPPGPLQIPAQSGSSRSQGPWDPLRCPRGSLWKKPASGGPPPAEQMALCCVQPASCQSNRSWAALLGSPGPNVHVSVGFLSCGLRPSWALLLFKILVPFVSFRNSSPSWLRREDTSGGQGVGGDKLCVKCLQVARTLSPHDDLETSVSSRSVDVVIGAQRGQMTLPRSHPPCNSKPGTR